jgi:shikimate 5-dehydrogenase
VGAAKDPITSGLAFQAFLPENYWSSSGAEAFIIGAGGSSIALSSFLARADHGEERPRHLLVSNRSPARLEEMRKIHRRLCIDFPIEYIHTPPPRDNNAVLAPGSPLTGEVLFPEHGLIWDFNYRGDLLFLRQAQEQARHAS